MNRTLSVGVVAIIVIVSVAAVAVAEINRHPTDSGTGATQPVYVGLVLLSGLFLALVAIIVTYGTYFGWKRVMDGRGGKGVPC